MEGDCYLKLDAGNEFYIIQAKDRDYIRCSCCKDDWQEYKKADASDLKEYVRVPNLFLIIRGLIYVHARRH